MRQELLDIAMRLHERFPSIDIRTDQCDMIRIITKEVFISVVAGGGGYEAKVSSLTSDNDFETPLLRRLACRDRATFERQLADEVDAIAGGNKSGKAGSENGSGTE